MELEELEQPPDLRRRRRCQIQVGHRNPQVQVAAQRHEFAVEAHGGLGILQGIPQPGSLLVEMRVEGVDVLVAGDEPGRRLLPHPRHTRQIVGGVAAQGGIGHVVRRSHAGARLDARLVVPHMVGHAPAGIQHRDVRVGHQLEGVAIPRHHGHLQPRGGGLRGESGQDVVGFETGGLHGSHPQHLQHLAQQAQLLAEDFRGLGPVGLVAIEALVAERPARKVERHRDALRLVVAQQVHQHGREPEHGVGDLSGGGSHVVGKRVEGPVGQGMPVDEEQAGHRCTRDGRRAARGEAGAPRRLTAGRRPASTPPTGSLPGDPRPRLAWGAAGSWRSCA